MTNEELVRRYYDGEEAALEKRNWFVGIMTAKRPRWKSCIIKISV